jgi:hypothetical protein
VFAGAGILAAADDRGSDAVKRGAPLTLSAEEFFKKT